MSSHMSSTPFNAEFSPHVFHPFQCRVQPTCLPPLSMQSSAHMSSTPFNAEFSPHVFHPFQCRVQPTCLPPLSMQSSAHMSSTPFNAEFSPHVFHPFQCRVQPTCLPPLSMQSSARLCISLNILFIISGSSLKFANSLTIRSLISSIDAGGVINTFPFTKPQRRKSHGVKSGERGCHSVGWSRAITRS